MFVDHLCLFLKPHSSKSMLKIYFIFVSKFKIKSYVFMIDVFGAFLKQR